MGNQKEKILVVDDSLTVVYEMSNILEDEGYGVFAATTGEEGFKSAEQTAPDLILLDVRLPDIDGFEICRRLKAEKTTKDIPVIFMTAMNTSESKVNGFESGGIDYVTKPIEIEETLARIRTHLTLGKMHAQIQVQNDRLAQEIAHRERAELKVRKLNTELEQRVQERTAELEETNAALKVLLRQREKDKAEIEENMVATVSELVFPYLDEIQNTSLSRRQSSYLEIIRSNLSLFVQPLAKHLSSKLYNLTPMEIKVANLVCDGKTNKEIASILNVSYSTVLTHRHHLRDKLGLRNKSVNLRAHLLSIK